MSVLCRLPLLNRNPLFRLSFSDSLCFLQARRLWSATRLCLNLLPRLPLRKLLLPRQACPLYRSYYRRRFCLNLLPLYPNLSVLCRLPLSNRSPLFHSTFSDSLCFLQARRLWSAMRLCPNRLPRLPLRKLPLPRQACLLYRSYCHRRFCLNRLPLYQDLSVLCRLQFSNRSPLFRSSFSNLLCFLQARRLWSATRLCPNRLPRLPLRKLLLPPQACPLYRSYCHRRFCLNRLPLYQDSSALCRLPLSNRSPLFRLSFSDLQCFLQARRLWSAMRLNPNLLPRLPPRKLLLPPQACLRYRSYCRRRF